MNDFLKNVDKNILSAVLPLKEEAMEKAEQEANKVITQVKNNLISHDWDLNKAAPRANSFNMSRNEYILADSKRKLYKYLTEANKKRNNNRTYDERSFRNPAYVDYVTMSPAKCNQYIDLAKTNAALQYDQFILKLNQKIGSTISAELKGNHVWNYSFLYVTKPDGTEEIWKTQMIVNRSKLGLIFNQFPTRKVKKS